MNGQRPNSNNMTIDGVANIDTGDNGGNMATTNIDSVAEFKILTNAYQAEYGRAVGGQVQVVTKSGTQHFHGSGYWYGRRGSWNANTWTNNRRRRRRRSATERDRQAGDLARRLRLHDRRADLHPGRLQHREEEAVLLLEPGVPEAGTNPPAMRTTRVPDGPRAPGRLLAERRQQRQPRSLHPRLHDRPALQRHRHARLLPGRRRDRPDPREPPLRARPQRAQASSRRRTASHGRRHELPEPGRRPARRGART